eukprot:scaffold36024_cov75-Phaeocystis_antarctica.AAC.3
MDIAPTKRLFTWSSPRGCLASRLVAYTSGGDPSALATSGGALWLAPVGLIRVFASVDAQEGGGCRVANLGCLA